MSQTPEGRQTLTDVYVDGIDRYGVACFNSRPDNYLLWSYYAGSHSGIGVRFDTRDDYLGEIPQPYLPMRVRYCKDFPSVSIYEPDRFTLVQKTLGTKAEAWQKRSGGLLRLGAGG